MKHLTRYDSDAFLPRQTCHSSRKLFPQSPTIKEQYSRSVMKAKPVIITRIKQQPFNFSQVVTNKSARHKLIEVILNLAKSSSKDRDRTLSRQNRMQTVRINISYDNNKKPRQLHSQSRLKQSSLEVVPIILQKRLKKNQLKVRAKTQRARSEIQKRQRTRQTVERRERNDIKQKLQMKVRRKKELVQRRMECKVARFAEQQLTPQLAPQLTPW